MSRRPSSSIVASPSLIGAVTVLVTMVAVFLAYNANQGLPFVPNLEVKVLADNASAVGRGAEVREGGIRVGFVREVQTRALPDGTAAAEIHAVLEAGDDEIPVDTTFTIRPRSPLGLKYLEMARGSADETAHQDHVFPVEQTIRPVDFDDVARVYDSPTRRGIQRGFQGFGTALAGRGSYLNQGIEELPRLFRHLEPVARTLADRDTQLGRFFDELGDAARVVAPLADEQSDFFTQAGLTFEAISREPESLKATIERTHPALQAGIDSFPVQRPFLTDSAALAREMQPVARELRPALPVLNSALERGIPVTRRSVAFYGDLRPALVSLRDLMEDPNTGIALRGLTANVTSLKPQIRYLGPYQTVCDYWTYFFTFFAEHVSQEGPYGYSQRAAVKSTGQQADNPSSMGSAEPANGKDYRAPSKPRGDPVHLHAQAYNAAIDEHGNADCENGQRGYLKRLSRFGAPRFNIVTDPHIPGNQGPTYKGRDRVPKGQTFTREPETGYVHP
jgi:phospholipid/cholesterol/gamma-HCH transport system substrate-binding protein